MDTTGWTVIPKLICEAVGLGSGGAAQVRVMPGGIIQIVPILAEGRQLKKVGKFLVAVSDAPMLRRCERNAA